MVLQGFIVFGDYPSMGGLYVDSRSGGAVADGKDGLGRGG